LVTAGTYLPIGIDRLQFYRPLGAAGWCLVTSASTDGHTPDVLKVDLTLWDASGNQAATFTGMTLKYVSQPTLQRLFGAADSPQTATPNAAAPNAAAPNTLESWLYELIWQVQAKPQPQTSSSTALRSRSWLIFADAQGMGAQLANALSAKGDRCFIIKPTDQCDLKDKAAPSDHGAPVLQTAADADTYWVNPNAPEAFNQLLSALTPTLIAENAGQLNCQLLYLWGLDAKANAPSSQAHPCGGLLHLVQAIAQFPALTARLWIVTQQAQAVDVPTPLQLQQTPLWGMARSLRLEHPQLGCTCIDLDPLSVDQSQEQLLAELSAPDPENQSENQPDHRPEDQIAYRQDQRFVARLEAHTDAQ
ncbi:MAG: polyketide synthase dehydratase domain-containing protein, partial [Cyanobacteria bacterium J06553_1]